MIGGGTVYYDAAGRHIGTVDRNGNETRFNHDVIGTETRLTSIDLPTKEGPRPAYEFQYDATTLRLGSVRVVGSDGGWLDYAVGTSGTSGFDIEAITSPDSLTTSFEYVSGSLTSVTDHRGAETEINYDYGKVAGVTVITPVTRRSTTST